MGYILLNNAAQMCIAPSYGGGFEFLNFVEASVERVLNFPDRLIYAILSDFREHHLRIVPSSVRAPSFQIIEGGIGAGTIIEHESSLGHEPQPVRYVVAEPEPGRVLTMTGSGGAIVQTFQLTNSSPTQCSLNMSAKFRSRNGLLGLIDRILGRMELERVLNQKLDNLELYAATLGATIRPSEVTGEPTTQPT